MAIVPDLSGNAATNAPYVDLKLVQNENILVPAETIRYTVGATAYTTPVMRDAFGDPYSGQVEVLCDFDAHIIVGAPGTTATVSHKPLPTGVIQIFSVPSNFVISVIDAASTGGYMYVTMLNKAGV